MEIKKLFEGYIVQKGKWTINEAFNGISNAYCSRCGCEIEPEVRYAIGLPPFCFNCGADMRGEYVAK